MKEAYRRPKITDRDKYKSRKCAYFSLLSKQGQQSLFVLSILVSKPAVVVLVFCFFLLHYFTAGYSR